MARKVTKTSPSVWNALNAPNSAVFNNLTTAMSCSIWWNPNSTTQTDFVPPIFNNQFSIFQISGSSTVEYSAASSTATGSANLTGGTWSALGFSYDTTNGTKGYFNGVADGTAAASGSIPAVSTILAFACDPRFPNHATEGGAVADAAVWTAVLTQAEFAALSIGARPYTIRSASLLAYWPFDGIQSPEPDFSGNGLNASLDLTEGTIAMAPDPPLMMFTPRTHGFAGWTPLIGAAGMGWMIRRRNKLMKPVRCGLILPKK